MPSQAKLDIVIITGLSGSGKSSAKACFEDIGYYAIDKLPVPLIEEFVSLFEGANPQINKVALVMDARLQDYLKLIPDTIERLRSTGHAVELIYLEADDEVLSRRFSTTRRPHPMSESGAPLDGIAKEKDVLRDLRAQANRIIDTTSLSPHQLKDSLLQEYGVKEASQRLSICVTSFGFKYGVPTDADLVFDVRFLPNPYFQSELKELSGHDKEVQEYVLKSELGRDFAEKLLQMLDFLIPNYQREGKTYLKVAIGCTGGRHRSVSFVGYLFDHLTDQGLKVAREDRDMHRDAVNT